MMVEHLTECPCNDPVHTCFVLNACRYCICSRLRACEERIKTHEGCADAERAEGYEDGWDAALADLVDVSDAATLIGVTRQRIYQMIDEGKLPRRTPIVFTRRELRGIS